MACLCLPERKGGMKEIKLIVSEPQRQEEARCVKPGRLGGLHVEARQNIPEPTNNSKATEAEAGIKVGSGGFQGQGMFYKEGFGILQTWT